MIEKADFFLHSCPGIPDSMWLASSKMLDKMIHNMWPLLGAFTALRMLVDAFKAASNGLSLPTHLLTLSQTLLITIFLHYYKPLLMFFDHFISVIAFLDQSWEISEEILKASNQKQPFWIWILKHLLTLGWADDACKLVSLFSSHGLIFIMHYFKAVLLLLSVQFGPLAAVFSLLPLSAFKKSFATWSGSYVHLTCWSITLKIFTVLTNAFAAASSASLSNTSLAIEQSLAYLILSAILCIAILCTPVWTARFITGPVVANLATALAFVPSKAGKLAPLTKSSHAN